MKAIGHGATDIGLVRDNNEDYFVVDKELGLFLVCDGMGGHAAGEVAASSAAHSVAAYLGANQLRNTSESLVEEAVVDASEEVYNLGLSSALFKDMGTTLSLLWIRHDKAVVAHVGDSRIHLLREGKLRLLTTNHTLANELVAEGVVTDEFAKNSKLANVLTRSLGREDASSVDTHHFPVRTGDKFLLCSDGLTNYIDEPDLVELLDGNSPQESAIQLVQAARERGGADNITAVVVRIDAD